MKALAVFVFAAVLSLVFSGCAAANKNIENAKLLRVGMTKSRVLEIMGEPLTGEKYNTPDIWFYFVKSVLADGLSTQDECLPLVFEKGRLAGWGNNFYARYRSRGVRNARSVELTGERSVKK